MKILDATAGSRAVWFDKSYPAATFIDIREGTYPGNRVLDCCHTDFPDGEFDLVIFDPPHMAIGPKAQMAQRYGSFPTAYIRKLVVDAFREFHRVLRIDGLVAFKWNDHDTSLSKVLAPVTGFDALIGVTVALRRVVSGNGHDSETRWVLLRRVNGNGQQLLDCTKGEG